jgi:hypothetical protein
MLFEYDTFLDILNYIQLGNETPPGTLERMIYSIPLIAFTTYHQLRVQLWAVQVTTESYLAHGCLGTSGPSHPRPGFHRVSRQRWTSADGPGPLLLGPVRNLRCNGPVSSSTVSATARLLGPESPADASHVQSDPGHGGSQAGSTRISTSRAGGPGWGYNLAPTRTAGATRQASSSTPSTLVQPLGRRGRRSPCKGHAGPYIWYTAADVAPFREQRLAITRANGPHRLAPVDRSLSYFYNIHGGRRVKVTRLVHGAAHSPSYFHPGSRVVVCAAAVSLSRDPRAFLRRTVPGRRGPAPHGARAVR